MCFLLNEFVRKIVYETVREVERQSVTVRENERK